MGLRFVDYLLLSLKKVPPLKVRRCIKAAERVGAPLEVNELEVQYLAGGDMDACTRAWIQAADRGVDIPWRTISAIDLMGDDPTVAVDLVAEEGHEPQDVEPLLLRVREVCRNRDDREGDAGNRG